MSAEQPGAAAPHPHVAGWKVDELIECISFGEDRRLVEAELLKHMPNAYEAHPDDPDGEAGHHEWPEADSHADRRIETIWSKLHPDVRAAINAAAAREVASQAAWEKGTTKLEIGGWDVVDTSTEEGGTR